MQEFSRGNENDSEAEVAVATVATLSQNVFEAPRIERGTSHSNQTSKTTSSGYERFTEEPQTYTWSEPPSYPTPSGPSFRRSRQRSITVEVPKLDPTPGLPSPNPPLLGLLSPSIPNFHLADLAYTKLIIHALKYAHKTVNGVLLGRLSVSDATIDVVDAVPLQHHWFPDLSSFMGAGLNVVRFTFPILYSVMVTESLYLARYTEVGHQLCPQYWASYSRILRGSRAHWRHDVVTSLRGSRSYVRKDISDSGRLSGESWEGVLALFCSR